MNIYCPECEAANAEGAEVCANCGHALKEVTVVSGARRFGRSTGRASPWIEQVMGGLDGGRMEGEPLQARIIGWFLIVLGIGLFGLQGIHLASEYEDWGGIGLGSTMVVVGIFLWVLSGIWHTLEEIAKKK